MKVCNATWNSRGFTVLESLIAMVVLTLAVLAMVQLIPASYGYTSLDSERMQAVTAGQEYLDSLRQYIKSNGIATGLPAAPTVAIDAGYSYQSGVPGTANASPGSFAMTPSCSAVAGTQKLFDCVVTVTWTQDNSARTVQLETHVASQK